MEDITRSAEKRQFFERLKGVGESDDSEGEVIAEVESFLKNARPRSRISPRRRQPTAHTEPLSSSAPEHSVQKLETKVKIKPVAAEDSGSETESDLEPSTPVRRVKTHPSKSQSKAQVIDGSDGETQSGFDPPPQIPRTQTLATKELRDKSQSSNKRPALKHSVSVPPVIKDASKAKRRKVQKITAQYETFKNKKFFFVPNDDIVASRKLRISKVKEHGGTRLNNWSSGIDFIVLENRLTYQHLLDWLKKELKLENILSTMHVVNTTFTADCFEYYQIMDVAQPCYQVPGAPSRQLTNAQPTVVAEPLQSSSLDVMESNNKNGRTPPPPLIREQSAPESSSLQKPAEDELEKAAEESRSLQFLSFDDLDNGFKSDLEASLASLPHSETRDWQNNFSCMHKGSDAWAENNPNARIIHILDQMSHYYDNMGDQYRSMSYRKAVTTLKKQHTRITSKQDALALQGIGTSIAEKIEEIVLTARLKKLESLMDDPMGQILQKFTQIYGVGMMQATRWVGAGHRTLDDLRTNAKLTNAQKVGLDHYDDFLRRIPREEVKKHGDYVLNSLRKLDPAYDVIIGGSYRRGKKDSGDIDLIISKPGAVESEICNMVLNQLVPYLTEDGFLTAKLSGIQNGQHGNKWHGCSCLPGTTIWRRIDLLLVPWDEMGSALIYFTGNDIFNRSMRLLASKKGMCLNQTGLYGDVLRKRNREKLNEGKLLESKSEQRIFDLLDVPWRPAEERNL